MRLIALHGRAGSGKDSAFAVIEQLCISDDKRAARRAFADPMKVSGMRALGFDTSRSVYGTVALANLIKATGRITVTWIEPRFPNDVQSTTITGRELWQNYGTESHRAEDLGTSFGPDFWVDNLLPLVSDWTDNFTDDTDVAVVTDLRFENEAKRVFDLGGEVWYIDADDRLGPNPHSHSSEQKLPDELITKTIDNNGTVIEFRDNVEEAFNV